jgi:hypothetical protein
MSYIHQGIKLSSIAWYKWGEATKAERQEAREAIRQAAHNCRQWLKTSKEKREGGESE